MFTNAILYRAHSAFPSATDLASLLDKQTFRPCSPLEVKRVGWSHVCGDQLVHVVLGQFLMLCCRRQERLLPPAAVKEEVEERAAAQERETGVALRKREKQLLKEQVYEELLPNAPKRTKQLWIVIDTRRQWVLVDSGSRKKAEEALDLLRLTLGSLKVTPLATQTRASQVMTAWLRQPGDRAEGWELGESCQLVASAGDDGVIRAAQVDLDCDEIKHHLESGRVCASLALTKSDQLSFTLQDDLSLKKLDFDSALLETVEDADDQAAQFDADAHLQVPLLFEVIEQLVAILGGEALPAAREPITEDAADTHQDAA